MVVLPAAAAVAVPAPDCAGEASSDQAAASLAVICKVAVEVVARRTEASDVLVNPDGTRTLRTYAQPQRVRRSDGVWAKVDPTLSKAADGSLVPTATTVGLRFSGGGSDPLVTIDKAGASLALSWSTPLPTPVVVGTDATYPEVLPGVDLRVSASIDGFSQVLIVKTRAAAANAALRKVSLRAAGKGVTLTASANGAITAKDGKGAVVFASGGAYMWDSPMPAAAAAQKQAVAQAGTTASTGSDDGAPPAHQLAIPVEVTSTAVSVTPSASLLSGVDTQFPLYIDPAFSDTTYKWTQTNKNSPNTSYWTTNRDYMRVGKEWQSANVWRTFLRFDNLQPLFGQTIISASVFVTLYHSGGCVGTPVELWHTKYVDDIYSNSWSLTTGHWLGALQAVNANANKGACPQPNMVVEFGNSNVKNEVQAVANSSTWHIDLGLKATNEADDYAWKKFLPSSAHMDVTYNLPPNTPVLQNMSSVTDCYQLCGNPATVRTVTPTLAGTVSDPNGGQLSAIFHVLDAAETSILTSGTVPAMSGSTATWTVPPGVLSGGVTYHWRVIATDESAYQTWSPSAVFTIDVGPPATPTVTSAQYPYKAWGAAVGTAGTFVLSSASSDAVDFLWSVDAGGATTTVATGTTTKTASVSYTPATDMVHTLHVKARDAAGNITANYDHQFWVTPAVNRYSYWKLDEASGTTAADSGSGGSALSPGTLSGAVAFGPGYPITGGTDRGAVFDGTGTTVGQIAAANPVLNTTKSFTVMAWVKPSDLSAANGYETALSQDGVNMSRFVLRYDKDANAGAGGWCFGMRATDTVGSNPVYACATGTVGSSHLPLVNEWVHLAGVYNATTSTIQIHVMGNQDSCDGEMVQSSFSGAWSATGPFVIGRAMTSGSSANHWHGSIDDVYAYQRSLDSSEICQQAIQ
jgi:hypothetical protein